MLPAVPRPAAGRDRRGARGARDPRPAARAGRRARRASSAPTSARRSTGWPRRRDGRDPVDRAISRREVRFRYFDEPVIAAARERGLRGGGRRPRGARAGPRPRRPRRAAGRPRRLPAAARADARRADGGRAAGRCAACCWRRSRAASTACARSRPFAEATVDGHRLLTARYRHEGPPPAPRDGVRGRWPSCRAPLRAVRRLGRGAARRRAGRRGPLLARRRRRRPAELAERVRAPLAGVALPAVRAPRRRRPSTAPGAGRGMSAHDAAHLPARAPAAWSRTRCCAACTR